MRELGIIAEVAINTLRASRFSLLTVSGGASQFSGQPPWLGLRNHQPEFHCK
jgi:hypothetical protein